MRYPSDPIRRLRLRVWATAAIGAAVTLGCLAWALAPLESAGPTLAVDAQPHVPGAETGTAEDAAPATRTPLLAARLWNPALPPASPTRQREEAPPPPPRYQLIGIIYEDGQYKAALYDPATDRLHVVRSGDSIEGCTIVAIDERSVELSNGTRSSTILLEDSRS